MDTGDRILKLRKELGLSRKELSEVSGVSESAIKQYETKKREPRVEQLQKLSRALLTDMPYLVNGKEPIENSIFDEKIKNEYKLLRLKVGDGIASEDEKKRYFDLHKQVGIEGMKRMQESIHGADFFLPDASGQIVDSSDSKDNRNDYVTVSFQPSEMTDTDLEIVLTIFKNKATGENSAEFIKDLEFELERRKNNGGVKNGET